ncbi:hypothetical protein SGQ83_01440 [Flavobacterium sp. Fl-318]|uniref:DUF4815 domain-containing protein n=1 Tax=Flavobacterium cupriresistens TaxID=2893885 RepID=A0ABU4R5Y4_9FLAO|nr:MULTISPECIES: hypothetical protein [unclassified Flavobacterium]MDX6187999.1 hypothetical protein [Flavobacterium sp. Fl-318]UFH42081.1 hypothetical protein LNP23_20010 [Flavobacterium sp. F-323]
MGYKDNMKPWFQTGKRPEQSQFFAFFDWIWFKDEKIPADKIESLQELLDDKVDKEVFDAHSAANNAHKSLFDNKQSLNEKGQAYGYAPLNGASKVTANYLDIVNDFTTGGTTKLASSETVKTLFETKEDVSNKSLIITASSTNDDYPSSKSVFDFVNQFVKSENILPVTNIINLVENKKLVPGNYYMLNDFQTIYTINGSDSAPPTYKREITSFVSNWATMDVGYDYDLIVGKLVTITKLPIGYSGALAVGQTTTVSTMSNNFYFRFANGMQNVVGLKFSFTTPRYTNGVIDNLIVNDGNGKPVIRPGGVLNTEVHNGTAFMDMTAAENLGVPFESLILKAKSTNEFEFEGKSATYPDDVIEYRLPSTGSVAIKGEILRRYNNVLNIDIRDDWRVKRYRRWKIDGNSILKILNQDQAVTSLTGFAGVYQFTATKSTTSTLERFYIAADLDSLAKAIDENTKVVDFRMTVASNSAAKDYTIIPLDALHYPTSVKMMKVSGEFENTVIQNNPGELNYDTEIDAEDIFNSTFVCSVKTTGTHIKLENSLFLDTLSIVSNTKSIITLREVKFLNFVNIEQPIGFQMISTVIGANSNNYNGNPFPNVRWMNLYYPNSSSVYNCLLGGSTPYLSFSNSLLVDCTLFVYHSPSGLLTAENSKVSFNFCTMKSMSIFNRARLINSVFDKIIFNINTTPANTAQRDLYVNNTDLRETVVKYNKTSRKLYYETQDANDVVTINTFALPT